MPSLSISSWFALSFLGLATAQISDVLPKPISGRFIVEYASGALKARDDLASKPGITVRKTYNSPVFNGASIEAKEYNIDSLEALPEIARVWQNLRYELGPLEPRLEADPAAGNRYTTHNSTGVSKLHDAGIFGEGAIVGVVDTGVWYNHPALGGCFGPGCKVARGFDLVGDGPWPDAGDKMPDPDPLDHQGHGTHVSGIVAGQTDFWTGVAPKATLYVYKVFAEGPSETTDEETLIDAFLLAFNDGVDVITSSIGGPSGWAEGAWATVASRLVEQGVFVSISAGNSGAAGPYFGSSGSSGRNVLAIASIDGEQLPASAWNATYNLNGVSNTITEGYLPATDNFPPTIVGWEIRPMTLSITVPDDACTPYPPGTPRLEGVIPLVRRGTCNFVVKEQNLKDIGAEYILIYNDNRPITTPVAIDGVLVAMITAETGEHIVNTVIAGGNVTGDFSGNSEIPIGLPYASGGKPSTFTSWGALNDLQIKPDVAAPGGNIFSTYLNNGYAILSGTSMACPYVAGVAALWVGVNGGRKTHGPQWARQLGRRIIASGKAVPYYDGTTTDYGFSAPVEQVGTGLVDAWKVVKYGTGIEFDKIALNDSHTFSRYHDVVITNNGKASVSYTFSNAPAAGVEALRCDAEGDCRLKVFTELKPLSLEVDVNLPRPFTLKPGESKTVSVNFGNPDNKGWNTNAMPTYSGKVIILGSNGEQFSVPYMGLASNLKTIMNPVYRLGSPISVSTVNNVPIEEKSSYTFNLDPSVQDFPRILAQYKWGSQEVRWDIFDADWTERKWYYPLVPGKDGFIGSVAGIFAEGRAFDPSQADNTVAFPIRDTVYRNVDTISGLVYNEFWWFGKLANGTKLAPGKYTMRFASLNPLGTPAHGDNWSVFKAPKITVLPPS